MISGWPHDNAGFRSVGIARNDEYTLSYVKRESGGHAFYHLTDGWVADYPLHYPHSGNVVFDNPEYFPNEIISWAQDEVRKHIKTLA
jgi:hypothetical protein